MSGGKSLEELTALIVAKGDEVRKLKDSGADKAALQPHVNELLELKKAFQEANGGVPYGGDAKKPEKKKADPAPQPEKTGPSKKDLKKLERKEKKKEGKDKIKSPAIAVKTAPRSPSAKRATSGLPDPIIARPTIEGDTIFFSRGRPPVVSYAAALLTSSAISFVPHVAANEHVLLEPQLFLPDGTTLFGDFSIARFIARRSAPALAGVDPFAASEVDQWLDFVHQYHLALPESDIHAFLSFLNSHLEMRTYLVGYVPTLADIAVYTFLQLNSFTGHMSALPHLSRWFALLSTYSLIAKAHEKVLAIRSAHAKNPSEAAAGSGLSVNCPPLEGAEYGKVCTRFPPEPSGYLHIGHAKALMLNDYYAKHYGGKMLVRFDDTNPTKEKDEYEDSIVADLKVLGVMFDTVTHTSDYFDLMEKYARQLIQDGLAYMDNTPQEKMQEERLNRIDSVHRNTTVEENMARFKTMLEGDGEWCLRAKIDMQSVNGTMRDPVLYRANPTPHHRTGTKYKAYPTYDLACPIVDSIEGVTHALRTTEYNDRDEQYYWLQKALRIRPVKIQAFSRLAFVQTELSKRKLTWFVDNKVVDGWNDPRFPTIQGVMRRGVSVDALRSFILSQGASRRTVLMEWDSFWSINRQGYEHSAPRYMALFKETAVPMDVEGGPAETAGVTIPLHPKFPEQGSRILRLSNKVLLEGQDAESLVVGDEMTLTRWGNVKILDIVKDASTGAIQRIRSQYLPDGDPRKTKKRFTWLADVEDLVPVVLTEFDYLITKKKIEENEDFKDFVNPVTKAEVAGIGDANLRNMKKGDVIQLERRGFYICDRPYLSKEKPLVLFMIPDGKTRAMSTLSGALKHV